MDDLETLFARHEAREESTNTFRILEAQSELQYWHHSQLERWEIDPQSWVQMSRLNFHLLVDWFVLIWQGDYFLWPTHMNGGTRRNGKSSIYRAQVLAHLEPFIPGPRESRLRAHRLSSHKSVHMSLLTRNHLLARFFFSPNILYSIDGRWN
jgi:hypothetical protein